MKIAMHAPITPTIIPITLNPLSVGDAGAINPRRVVPIKPPTTPATMFASHPICPSDFMIIEAIHPTIAANTNVIIKLI